MESINVVVDDEHKQADVTYDVGTFWEHAAEESKKEDDCSPTIAKAEAEPSNKGPSIRVQKDHPSELIIGDPNSGVVSRSREQVSNSCFVSKIEPKNVKEALTDEFWINVMQEELGQFERNESKYAKNIVKKFGMENASHKRTPAPTHLKLSKDEKGTNVDQSLYRSMIGSLLYLTASRLDIAFAVGTSPSKNTIPRSETASDSRAPNMVGDQDVVLDVLPLNSVPAIDPVGSIPRKMHARKSTGGSIPETFSARDKEGTAYVHNAIAGLVTRILNEGHKVEGISVPLAQAPAPENNKDNQVDASKDHADVETSETNNVEGSDAKDVEASEDKDAEILETEKAEEVTAASPKEKATRPTDNRNDVVDLDNLDNPIDIADDDLISSISNRVRARRGKQVDDQHPPKTKVAPLKNATKEKIKKVSAESSRTGSKVAVKKRKERSVSDSEDNVLSDVPDIPSKKKIAVTKSSTKVRDVPLDNIYLHYASNAIQWKFVYQRRLALERELANDALECQEVMKLIKSAGRDAEAQPELEVIDNEVCKVITGGKVKKWPIKSKLSASLLNVRYALLHKIGAANWVPTNHNSTIAVGLGRFIYAVGTKTKFDYGTYIFDQTMRQVGTSATKLPIAFPSLICGIILKQHPGILKAKDFVCKRESALSFHYKLLQRSDDITSAGTSQPSKSVNKTFLIAELKKTCKELDNRKMKLEKLIQSLEQSTDDDHAGGSDGDNMDEDKGADSGDKEEAEDGEGTEDTGSSDADEETSGSSDEEISGSSDEETDGSDN
ncbi:uncharacterized protein LOC131641607 [Vicia villosa]|uniref:uncharacterized protein LOC131641607 n=1 Tax=Vicia villosa TaxID=3911 RepID=UPI00273B8B3E|nr:uncharacterized protein LOC131641607 [Vicia villosa]